MKKAKSSSTKRRRRKRTGHTMGRVPDYSKGSGTRGKKAILPKSPRKLLEK